MIEFPFDDVINMVYNAKKGVEVRKGLGQMGEYCKKFADDAGKQADTAKQAAETAASNASTAASTATTKAEEAASSASAAAGSAAEAKEIAGSTAEQTMAAIGLSVVDGALCMTYDDGTTPAGVPESEE